mmetsp:Transcript_32264/g.86074  ORF Transcript_32264/g.86074 Transcript_32264/m.86074 type:complete len:86 (+) Transcript_32264:519-776(+)
MMRWIVDQVVRCGIAEPSTGANLDSVQQMWRLRITCECINDSPMRYDSQSLFRSILHISIMFIHQQDDINLYQYASGFIRVFNET